MSKAQIASFLLEECVDNCANIYEIGRSQRLPFVYCTSRKYSGNNKLAIIALCSYALLQNPVFIKFLIELPAAVPVHRYT